MRRYIALIRKIPESDFGVDFPDFPGCVTAGRTLDQALARAPEALALHAAGMIEDGGSLPAPRGLEEIMAEPDHRDAVAAIVELAAPRPEIERVNLTIDKRLREAIDARAAEEGMSRSGWIAAVARRAVASADPPRDRPVRNHAPVEAKRARRGNAKPSAKERVSKSG